MRNASARPPCGRSQKLRGAGRRFDAVLVPVQAVGVRRAARPRSGRRLESAVSAAPRPRAGAADGETSPPCASASSCAPRQTPRNGISRAHRLADQLQLGRELRLPGGLLAAEGDDPVEAVEVGQRALEVLLDRAQRRRGVAEEGLLQVMDNGDARVSREHGRGQGWAPERPQAPPRDDDLARRRDRCRIVRRLRRRDQPDRSRRGALLSCRRPARGPRDADAGRDGGRAARAPARSPTTRASRSATGARFVVGWLYWYFWVIVLAVEAAAGAAIIQEWLPGVPIWASSLVLMLLLTATNLVSVRAFGEFEFWFASIKVAAIVAFIVIAAGYVLFSGNGVSAAHRRGRLHAQGRRRDPVRHRDRDLRLRRRGDRHDRRRRVRRARRVRAQGDQLRDRARAHLLRALGVPDRRDPAVELRRAGQVAVRRDARRDRHPGRRAGHERDRADRGALVPELGPLRGLADELRARPAR